jgi:hypothetical protein
MVVGALLLYIKELGGKVTHQSYENTPFRQLGGIVAPARAGVEMLCGHSVAARRLLTSPKHCLSYAWARHGYIFWRQYACEEACSEHPLIWPPVTKCLNTCPGKCDDASKLSKGGLLIRLVSDFASWILHLESQCPSTQSYSCPSTPCCLSLN